MELKQPTQSVIASLMGFDEMSPQQPSNRHHKVLSENYLRKIASIGVREKRSTSEGRSFRMSFYKQPEFKDIFEVPKPSKLEKHHNQPVQKWNSKTSLNEAMIPFTREKFMDVKHLSLDTKFQHLKEFDEMVELHPNKDLKLRDSEMNTTQLKIKKFRQNPVNGFSKKIHRKLGVDFSPKLPKCQLSSKDGISAHPTRIVVLKPNIGKAEDSTKFFFPFGSYDGSKLCDRRHKVCSSGIGELDSAVGERRKVDNNMEFSRHTFIISRELAKEINRQIKHNIWTTPTGVSESGRNGDGTSADESDLVMPSSETSFECKNLLNGRSIDRESKKRVSERWRTTKRFQEVGLCCSSSISSQGEWYLRPEEAFHRNKSRKQNFDQKIVTPRNSSASCKKSGSSASMNVENIHTSQETCMLMKGKLVWKDLSDQNSVHPKLQSCNDLCLDSHCVGQEIQLILDYPKNNSEQGPSKQSAMVPKSSFNSVASIGMVADTMADAETEDVSLCSDSPKDSKVICHMSSFKYEESSSGAADSSNPLETSFDLPEEGAVGSQCLMVGTEYFGNPEKASQPSPVSVLDPLVKEDNSSVSSGESVNADHDGLQMQLELLKSKSSELHSDGAGMVMKRDEDIGEGSTGLPEEHGDLTGLFIAGGSWEFSYLVDVLDEAGSHDGGWDLGFETWHSPECPLSPVVFKVLENKYEEERSWERSERRLLFDRLNIGLLEIFHSRASMRMLAKPLRKRFGCFQWSREVIEGELWSVLVNERMQASMTSSDKELGRDMMWLEMGDEVDFIGREIERFLIDELAEEFVSMENF